MKKVLIFALFSILYFGFNGNILVANNSTRIDASKNTIASPKPCTYNGNTLHVGPKGGCYYINKNGNKTYVDRSYCKC